ncbi:hypothetical protein [Virgibacillus oceani]|uniref:Uncharacterized protein n=1 Tax=Virgibacillus oceani TaxID=1479511 RepID=A0A917M988_9BACI|nr:hypothetical protein [Virgibacillus oceani]GGG87373.1 hypothetical protein GCM10011398_36530 [Virgibacillus oceani]
MIQIRDFTELSMMSKRRWDDEELEYFQHALSQLLPYVNAEGLAILQGINEEIKERE